MDSLFSPSSLLFPLPSRSLPYFPLRYQHLSFDQPHHHDGIFVSHRFISFPVNSYHTLHITRPSLSAAIPSNEGAVSVINFEDFIEKDWSFLDANDLNSEEHRQKTDRIIKSGKIEETSRILVSIGSEGFVDQLVDSSPCQLLLVVHDSLFLLAGIKEKYDKVKCWQGELIYVPEKWAPFDVVFLYFLPALPFKLDQVFATLVKHCSPGARLVISHSEGREALEQQRKQFPDVVVSDLPDKKSLENVGANHSFEEEFEEHKEDHMLVQSGWYRGVPICCVVESRKTQNHRPIHQHTVI
ncbi:uncharacterized protein LOC110821257 isoform X1 [Carica papaya]|uniref:uncharacterized protein LOC110821257 isoform X1 n=1 Tax=Carica papaya TaxID=3649 RepID=UPI000B8CB870|nr:uncharacterized protein LOC110821257 isoform X1 [Carica papaya]XP_021906728.1 uncharacterized protein LOC110821257 isoform X1 [Carica papaya]